jgi:hypothetical protein
MGERVDAGLQEHDLHRRHVAHGQALVRGHSLAPQQPVRRGGVARGAGGRRTRKRPSGENAATAPVCRTGSLKSIN